MPPTPDPAMPTIRLHDLAGLDDLRFSPYCWRAKFALAHKGLSCETVPTGFTGIATVAGGGHATVPVIEDGGRVVRDSFAIAEYLEAAYPDRPSLFGGDGGRAAARFVEAFAVASHIHLSRAVLVDIHDVLDPADRGYFRESREKRFGATLEAFTADPDAAVERFRDAMTPVRLMLKSQPFIGGDRPLFADYVLAGTLMWPRVVSAREILAPEDPVADWFGRVRALHGGFAEAAPTVSTTRRGIAGRGGTD